jgi:hypothetical protein
LEPDSGEETTSEVDPTSPIPSHYRTPPLPQPLPLMNRSKSEDPPGTSFILANHTRITTYDTAVEEEEDDDDDDEEETEADGSSSFQVSTTTVEVQPPAPPPAVVIKRNDPPELTTTSTVTQKTSSISSTSSSLIPQTKCCNAGSHVPTEVVPKAKLDVPLKKFDKDRNLISNAPLDGPTRSPEVTLVADSSKTNQVFSKEQNDQHHWNHTPGELQETTLVIPSMEKGLDHLSHEIHRSVHFSNVHIHEHLILDTSGDSESSLSFVVSSSPPVSTTNQLPQLKSSRTQNDPPPSVLSMVSTVDEYEARREPYRRRLKEQEKQSGKSNATDSRSDQLRRILSIGTTAATTTTSFLIHDNNNNNNAVALNNASDYVSVQELVPKEQSRIGASRVEEQQPPLSQNANDIFEAYQQSFIGSEQGDYPSPATATTTSSRTKHRRPRPINRRSVSAPVAPKSPQLPAEGRGLFRRFFPKKELHLKIEI